MAQWAVSLQRVTRRRRRRQNGSARTQMQTRVVSSSFRWSQSVEQQKYQSVMWINDPISQLEVCGLLFPNSRSLKSVGILIAANVLPTPFRLPLSPSHCLAEGKRGEKKMTWIMSKYLKRLMWCLWASLSASGRRNQQRLGWRSEGKKTCCLFIFDLFLSLSSSLCLALCFSDSFTFFSCPLYFPPTLPHCTCSSLFNTPGVW